MPWLAVGAGAAIAGGIGSYLANASANERAQMLQDQNLQNWIKLNVPDPAQQQVVFQKFVNQGQLDPKLEAAIKAQPSQFQNIITSAKDKAAQNDALSQLQDIGSQGGLRLQDQAALQDAQSQADVKNRANRQGIESEMARRGLGGSGFDVASQLQGQQGTADQLANSSLKTAASAQDRALQAIQGAGTLAGQYQNQDFNQQAQKAGAADKINMFNTQNLQDVSNKNVASQNAAQEYNLNNQQRISDQNAQIANQNSMYNNQLQQQGYQNQVQKLQGQGGAGS